MTRGVAVAVLFVAAIALISVITRTGTVTGKLLVAQNWSQFAGASSTPEGLRIRPLDRTIIHQAGPRGPPNPPVGLLSPHLSVSGDFRLTARMEEIDARGTLQFYGKPPIVYDQWRFETGGVAIDVGTRTIVVRIWDGSSSNSVDMRT